MQSSFARPSSYHRFIRQKPKTFRQSLGCRFDVSNDHAHLLKVADGFRQTKRFIVRAQFTKNLSGSDTAATEKIASPCKKILAALQVEAGLVLTWDRLRTRVCSRAK